MGIHIHIYKVERAGDRIVTAEESDAPFENARHTGDVEFVGNSDLFDHIYDRDIEMAFYRPISFDDTRKWVTENIEADGNKLRLLNILELMGKDETMYFNTSF